MEDPIKQTLVGLKLSQLHALSDLTYATGITRSELIRNAIDMYLKAQKEGK